MKISFFNRCYWPDSEATGQLLAELAEFLTEKQHEVNVVVGQPNFVDQHESGSVLNESHRNGVRIHRLAHSQIPKHKKFGRIRSLVSFTLAVRSFLKRNANELVAQSVAPSRRSDAPRGDSIWVCETDPFLLPLVVGPAARSSNVRLIYYLQDIYPDVAVALGVARNSIPIRLLRQRLQWEYERAERIIVLDEDMRTRLARWGLRPERIDIVPNWVDCSLVQPNKIDNSLRKKWEVSAESLLVMHSGNMGMTQRLEVLIRSFQSPDVPENARLFLVGNGAKRPELEIEAKGQKNITFLGYQPKELLGESLSAADLHVVSMDANITGCLAPSKLYGIMASATAVLAVVPRNNAVWKLIRENQLGWCVEPGDSEGIVNAVRSANDIGREGLRAMGERGREFAMKNYDRQVCCELFERKILGR